MSIEIELKAHVYNRKEVIKKLNSFAKYLGHTYKKDTYYHLPSQISVRIRNQKEESSDKNTSKNKIQNYFTYKKKETKLLENGTQIEVNIENESLVENPDALEQLFFDLGGKTAYTKEKDVDLSTPLLFTFSMFSVRNVRILFFRNPFMPFTLAYATPCV